MAGRTTLTGTQSEEKSKSTQETPRDSGKHTGSKTRRHRTERSKKRSARKMSFRTEITYSLDSKHLEEERISYLVETIQKYSWMVPTWLKCLQVTVTLLDESVIASVDSTPQYRKAELAICDKFWGQSPVEQELTIVEEFAHLGQARVIDAWNFIMNKFVAEEDRQFCDDMFCHGIEDDAHDTMDMIWRRMRPE